MIKNRTAQLIYQTFYCTLGLVGFVACLGVYDDVSNLRWDFYVHFTNLSNFLCIGVMLTSLIQTARKKEDSYVCRLYQHHYVEQGRSRQDFSLSYCNTYIYQV